MSIAESIAKIRASLSEEVRLIAVSKQVPTEAMREAYKAGIRDFGESRIQETETKQKLLEDLPDITWHLIGHLQTNKAQKALQLFQWIHSVDSLKLAQRLDRLAAELNVTPQVCLQVKLTDDPHKHGFTQPQLLEELPALIECHHLSIQGLMAIPPLGLNEGETLTLFENASHLAQDIRQQWPQLPLRELSMGMSGDYHLAVKAGSTMVRLGTILFGERGA
ncbi:YggS family pyridoxal phosphate-dependent enzyme [Ancylothrix sp. C2]|uniref:YggS family pyridoxal phosphate-dependent enzyme n=1 Tax=Ancylothrix sp. D3o TaxID=2953691 RepID=UPI0021BB2663|nr:YggS family pyridoxal phosphate-dependent enzyme [Ancylothrix sp. D3o]MCT7949913.1 YggS family pyridoxal phosphate-dependent enzyme [Ancylothrix sp. D3o]